LDPFVAPGPATGGSHRWAPAIDLYETPEDLFLNAYLPGMSREEIHVQVEGNTVRLSGSGKPHLPEGEVTVHLAQGGFGKFDIRYTLPVEVQSDAVQAVYRNGILELRLPKAEAARRRVVEVQVEA
jgi:HSP20 family protein